MPPTAPLPQVDFPTIQVSAKLPGASAETMAASVTAPLQPQFALIAGVTELTSTSSLGSSAITVQFDLARDIDAAAGDILSAINAAGGQLPTNLPSPPSYKKVNPADSPILLLALTSASLPLTVVDDFAENILAQQLSQISGVAQITVNGQQKPAVRIQLDPAKIASLGLALEDVRTQIVNATADAPKGTFDGAQQSFAVYDNDQILAAAPWNDIIVSYRSGAPVRIRDIGRAVDGPEDTKLAAWANGTRCILLAVYKQPGANVIDTVDQVAGGPAVPPRDGCRLPVVGPRRPRPDHRVLGRRPNPPVALVADAVLRGLLRRCASWPSRCSSDAGTRAPRLDLAGRADRRAWASPPCRRPSSSPP